MNCYVKARRVISNDLLLEEALYSHVPTVGFEYMSDGTNTFKYLFATWGTHIDESFPANITGGTVHVTYWYLQLGGGPGSYVAHARSLFLGDDVTEAMFNTSENPIASVNGQSWTGGLDVSTGAEAADIVAANSLNSQSFERWIKIWGACQLSGMHYHAAHQTDSMAAAVYAVNSAVVPKLEFDDLVAVVQGFIRPEDLVADFLDERLRGILDKVTKYQQAVDLEGNLYKELAKIDQFSQKDIQRALLQAQREKVRIDAVERILAELANQSAKGKA